MEIIEGLVQLVFVILAIMAIINGDAEAAHFGIIMAFLLRISGSITDIKYEIENVKNRVQEKK